MSLVNANDFAQHPGRVTPQVRRYAHIFWWRSLFAIFDQAMDPHAIFKVHGIRARCTAGKQMNVVATIRESSGEITRQPADPTNNAGRILLAE